MRGNSHVRCGAGENLEIVSKNYLSLSGAKSQGMKQLMAGLGLILLAIILVPVLQNMMTGAV